MALDLQRINAAYQAGYDDDKILESIERNDPEFGQRIKTARESGYDSQTIMGSIKNRLDQQNNQPSNPEPQVPSASGVNTTDAVQPSTDIQQQKPESKPEAGSPGLFQSFKSGLNESSTGEIKRLLNGDFSDNPHEERDFIDTFAHGIGSFIGDLPAFAFGGAGGAAAGSAVAGPPGAIAGAGAGGMGLAEFIKEALVQFREHRKSDETFGQFLKRAETISGSTLRGASMGGILSAVNASLPLLKKIPGLGKVFDTKIGGKVGTIAAETAAAGTIPALSEGRLPTANEYANAAALITGLHIPRLIRIKMAKEGEKSGLTPEEFAKSERGQEILKEVPKPEKPNETPPSKEVEVPKVEETKTDQKTEKTPEKVEKAPHENSELKITEQRDSDRGRNSYHKELMDPNGESVGELMYDKENNGDLSITHIYVDPRYQRKGNAKRLVKSLIDENPNAENISLSALQPDGAKLFSKLIGRELKPTMSQDLTTGIEGVEPTFVDLTKKDIQKLKDNLKPQSASYSVKPQQMSIKKPKKPSEPTSNDIINVGDEFINRSGKKSTITQINDKTFEYKTENGDVRSGPISSLKAEVKSKPASQTPSNSSPEALQDDITSKATTGIQKRIDALEAKIKQSKGKRSPALVKNLNIQKKKLALAKKLTKNSVPKSPEAVNTKEPTLVHENTGKQQNLNVIKAIAKEPVETLSKGAFLDSGWRPGFQWYSKALRKAKRGTRAALRWTSNKFGVTSLKANPESSIYKRGFRAAEDFLSRKAVFKERFFTKWRESIHKNKEITKQDREDMIFYRERTGNPFIKGDTFEALSKRMSKESKHIVDTVIDEHMKESLAIMNESPFMQGKEVNPRQAVEDIYIRHFYSGKISTEKINKIYDQMQSRFGTDNPFKNKRTFLTFDQALREAGLVPKYRDIVQNLAAQDGMLARVISNNELVANLHAIEKQLGQKLIVRSKDKTAYQQAKNDGWIPFQDAYLRSYVAGTNKAGKLQWAVSEAPALVHPDLAPSMQGIFNRDAYKPDNAAVRLYDMYNSAINKIQVSASLFHFNALGESMTGSGGFITSIVLSPKWWRQGTRFLENSKAVEDAVGHGLKINRPVDLELEKANTFYNRLITKMQASNKSPIRFAGRAGQTIGSLANIHKFLFGSFQPRMKVVTYENYVNRTLKQFAKKGVHPNEELLRQIKRESASTVNDQFGGQNFELMPLFNNKNSKGIHRLISYPDWTVSAIREVVNAFASDSPIRRKLGQRYLIEYAIGLGIGTQMLSLLTTGLTNKSDGSITWDAEKAHTTFNNEDPKRRNFFDIAMPDINVTIAGQNINVGRDENGRQYYMHGGKKVREIGAYLDHPVAAIFSKLSPALRLGTKFTIDHTPSADGLFPVQGAYVEGEFRPWNGTKKGTLDRANAYAKEIINSSLPFSLQTIIGDYFNSNEDWKAALARTGFKFLASGGGALSVSKGISLRSAEQYYEKAFNVSDIKERNQSLKALRVVLRDNGYTNAQIDRQESKIKNRVTKQAKPR